MTDAKNLALGFYSVSTLQCLRVGQQASKHAWQAADIIADWLAAAPTLTLSPANDVHTLAEYSKNIPSLESCDTMPQWPWLLLLRSMHATMW
jgi:hypothetical protein